MLRRLSFRHIRIRTFIASAFGTMVVIGFRSTLLVKEMNTGSLASVRLSSTSFEWTPIDIGENQYDWNRSTEENYMADNTQSHGKYGAFRKQLDHKYHSHYTKSRQLFHDTIIDLMLYGTRITDQNGNTCDKPTQPWIVFTAGAMGAGKSWTIRNLAQRGYFPLHAFVAVDPDDIRRHLPEFDIYVSTTPEQAGDFTRKEAGYVAETITLVALQRGHNILVDGSLRDFTWYKTYFANLRAQRSNLNIAILHITAPPHAVLQRAEQRARITGRVVPLETLELAMKEVPKSVEILAPLCDFYTELYNAPDTPDVEIQTANIAWSDFTKIWIQSCGPDVANEETSDCFGSKMECESKNHLSKL